MRMVITTGDLEEGAHHVSEEIYKKVMLLIMTETHPKLAAQQSVHGTGGISPLKAQIPLYNGYCSKCGGEAFVASTMGLVCTNCDTPDGRPNPETASP